MYDEPTAEGNLKDSEPERDAALKRILEGWRAPAVPESLDARVLASYRRMGKQEAWWRRFFTGSVRVPLPVAATVLALLLVSAASALRPAGVPKSSVPPIASGGPIQAAHVEAPVLIHTSLAGFEPVSEVNVTVVTERRQ